MIDFLINKLMKKTHCLINNNFNLDKINLIIIKNYLNIIKEVILFQTKNLINLSF